MFLPWVILPKTKITIVFIIHNLLFLQYLRKNNYNFYHRKLCILFFISRPAAALYHHLTAKQRCCYNFNKIKKRKKSLKSMEARRKKSELRVNALGLTQYILFLPPLSWKLAVYKGRQGSEDKGTFLLSRYRGELIIYFSMLIW
jgi:hypothetical protein